MNTTNVDQVLDLKGLLCPIPIVKINIAVKKIELGETVTATATDAGVIMDIPAWCSSTGNELISMDEEGGIFTFEIKRLK